MLKVETLTPEQINQALALVKRRILSPENAQAIADALARGSLDMAIDTAFHQFPPDPILSDLISYREALVEASNPQALADRLEAWAAFEDARASGHEASAADSEGIIARRPDLGESEGFMARASGARKLAVEARANAALMRADAVIVRHSGAMPTGEI